MSEGGNMRLVRSIVVRTLSLLIIVGSLAASVLSLQAAIDVTKPNVKVSTSAETFDVIFVLSGEKRRTDRGFEIAEAGRAQKLVLFNGEISPHAADICATKEPYWVICIAPKQDSTIGEFQAIEEFCTTINCASALIVTSSYHVKRSDLVAQRMRLEVQLSYDVIQARKLGIKVFRREVLKLIYERLFRK